MNNDVVMQIACKFPPQTRLRLKDDYPHVVREVVGFKVVNGEGYLLFKDREPLSMKLLDLIKEVLPDADEC